MKLIDNVKRRRTLRKLAELPDGKVWRVRDYNSWGSAINFSRTDDEGHHWHGFYPYPPEPGDLFEATTVSGHTAHYKVLEVERVRDPRDMFFVLTSKLGKVVQP